MIYKAYNSYNYKALFSRASAVVRSHHSLGTKCVFFSCLECLAMRPPNALSYYILFILLLYPHQWLIS